MNCLTYCPCLNMSKLKTLADPCDYSIRPVSMEIVVDLPAPFCPKRAKI